MRHFQDAKRLVIKLGTNILTQNGKIDTEYIDVMAGEVAELTAQHLQVLLVTSGAIGLGASELKIAGSIKDIKMRQACAATGQPILMHRYREAFARHGLIVGQILLTQEVLNNRRTYLNLRNSVETLLFLGVIPIFNENDNVSTAEIGNAFGDNDRLSALIASDMDADLLVILTDIDALYDADPKENPSARRIPTVESVTDGLMQCAGGAGSLHSTGGMKTKLRAVAIASNAGCRVLLAHGRKKCIVRRLLAGEDLGTLFLAGRRLSSRARWILNSVPRGKIRVDEGALQAIRNRKSLLPSGILDLEGVFDAGEVVSINDRAKAVVLFDSSELGTLIGCHSTEIAERCGENRGDVIAKPEDIAFLEDE